VPAVARHRPAALHANHHGLRRALAWARWPAAVNRSRSSATVRRRRASVAGEAQLRDFPQVVLLCQASLGEIKCKRVISIADVKPLRHRWRAGSSSKLRCAWLPAARSRSRISTRSASVSPTGAQRAPPQPGHAPKREPPSIERGDRIGLGDGVAIGRVGIASAPSDPGGTARSTTGPRAINVQLTSSTSFSGSTKARTIIGVTPMRYLHRSQRPTWRRPSLSTSQSRSSR
jgi:hypothetical protein